MITKFKTFMLIVLLTCTIENFAGNISLQDAKKVAVNFYFERINQYENINYSDIKISETFEIKFNQEVVYYIFNYYEKGYTIVAAEDNVYPVIGYSFNGIYNEENEPPQFIGLMQNYSRQIVYAREHRIVADNKIKEAWKHFSTNNINNLKMFKGEKDVEPLLVSTWNQGVPYNELCPEDANGPGGHVLVGCPATAMSQIMLYYRYPEHGTGSNSYYQNPYGTISADFGNATYDYNSMLNSVNSSNYEVAELSFHAGVAIETVYGPYVSGVYYLSVLVDGFKNHFSYSDDVELVFKTAYTQTEWEDLLKSNLDEKIPIIYTAVDLVAQGGHTFICDGYQGTNYFHMNWGWGGVYDGYFYLDNLSVAGYNFTAQHQVIVNIYPADVNYPYYCGGATTLSAINGTFEDGSGPLIYQDDTDCSWLIDPQTPQDSIESITIDFTKFDTEQDNDLVTIYDGATINAPVLSQFSGSSLPASVTSTGNKMLVTFTTNENTTAEGWQCEYYSEVPVFCSGLVSLTEPTGTLSDGSGTFNYHNSLNCMWKIEPTNATSVTLNFISFETEENEDILSIYDDQTLIAEYSGFDIPESITAESGIMFIIFHTNNDTTYDGWEANYTIPGLGDTENINTSTQLMIYPNPVKNKFFIEFSSEDSQNIQVELINITGKTVYSKTLLQISGNYKEEFDVSSFSKGIYYLRVIGNNSIVNKKVILK